MYVDRRPLDRGTVTLRAKACPDADATNVMLSLEGSNGQPDPDARFTVWLVAPNNGRQLALKRVAPGVFAGQAKLAAGRHGLLVEVAGAGPTRQVTFNLGVPVGPGPGGATSADAKERHARTTAAGGHSSAGLSHRQPAAK